MKVPIAASLPSRGRFGKAAIILDDSENSRLPFIARPAGAESFPPSIMSLSRYLLPPFLASSARSLTAEPQSSPTRESALRASPLPSAAKRRRAKDTSAFSAAFFTAGFELLTFFSRAPKTAGSPIVPSATVANSASFASSESANGAIASAASEPPKDAIVEIMVSLQWLSETDSSADLRASKPPEPSPMSTLHADDTRAGFLSAGASAGIVSESAIGFKIRQASRKAASDTELEDIARARFSRTCAADPFFWASVESSKNQALSPPASYEAKSP